MAQPIDVHLWPIFSTIQEELDDLRKLISDELIRLVQENERLEKRIAELDGRAR